MSNASKQAAVKSLMQKRGTRERDARQGRQLRETVGEPNVDEDDDDHECPCEVVLYRIPVEGGSSITILKWIAGLFIDNPDDKTLYHSALKVQLPEGDECPTYCIELTELCDDEREAEEKGEKSKGGVIILPGFIDVYGIRAWRNGRLVDEEKAVAPVVISTDCDIAKKIVDLVGDIPTLDYGDDEYGGRWSSNSAISWLLEKAGLNPAGIAPPPDGLTPGWDDGIKAAK